MLQKLFLVLVLAGAGAIPASASTTVDGLPNPNFEVLDKLDLTRLPKDEQGNRIVARVNGRPIPEEKFTRALNRAVKLKEVKPGPHVEAMKSAIAAPVIDTLIRSTLILEYAEKHGLTATEEEVSLVLRAANEKLPPGRKLQDLAMQRGEPPESVREEIRERLIQNRVIEHLGRDVGAAPPDQEALLLKYAAEMAENGHPTSATEVRARHLVLRCPADSPTTVTEQVRQRAEKVLKLIRDGMDFGHAVRTYSQDRNTRDLDGDVGWFARGRMYPAFERAAFALQPGQVSDVVQTPVGFHIIQVTDRREAGIQHLWQQEERLRRFRTWIDQAWREARIERYL